MFYLLFSSTGPKKYYKFDEFFKQNINIKTSLDLTLQYYFRTNFQEFGMILQCKYAEYKSFLLISRTIISLLVLP